VGTWSFGGQPKKRSHLEKLKNRAILARELTRGRRENKRGAIELRSRGTCLSGERSPEGKVGISYVLKPKGEGATRAYYPQQSDGTKGLEGKILSNGKKDKGRLEKVNRVDFGKLWEGEVTEILRRRRGPRQGYFSPGTRVPPGHKSLNIPLLDKRIRKRVRSDEK